MPKRTPSRKPIGIDDIYEIRQPLQCDLSPGGERLVVSVSQADKAKLKSLTHLWMIGTNDHEARQFTRGTSSESSPKWSPDGRTVAFLSDRSGKGELWTIPAEGGEARQLTEMKGSVTAFSWHPRGNKLVVTFVPSDEEAREREERRKRGDPGAEAPRVRHIRRLVYKLDGAGFLPQGRSHLYLVDAETGRARPLTDDDAYDETEPSFSPDGRWIHFVSNRSQDPDRFFQRIDLWRMPARGGELEKIRSFDGPSQLYRISPDGRWIAFVGRREADGPWHVRHDKVWLIPAQGGRPMELAERLDRSCVNSTLNDTFGFGGSHPPVWSPDSAWVYWVLTNEGNSEIWRSHVGRRRAEPVVNEPGVVLDYAMDFERGWIHTVWSDLTTPGEIRRFPLPPSGATRRLRTGRVQGGPLSGATVSYASSSDAPPSDAPPAAESGAVRRITFNEKWLSRRDILIPEEIWYEGKGGHRLQGWILEPRLRARPSRRTGRPRRRPAVLYIHGGPAAQYGRVYLHEFQVLAAHGYTVFFTNPRGGTGYSERHLNAIVGRWGTVDYDDLMRFTDVVLRRKPHLDRRRLGVAGGSYGGFMTNWIIGHTHRFACAVSSRSISNFMSFIGSSDFGYAWPQGLGMSGPWEGPKSYLRMSPLTYLANMKTPTLIEHQEEDHRCPIEQAEQLWAALKSKGVPVEFLRYPGEPHGMSRGGRPDRRVDRLERIVVWFERWLRG